MSKCYAQSHLVHENLELAIERTTAQINDQIDGEIDLLFAFAAGYAPAEFDRLMGSIQARTGSKHVLGCSCETAIGGNQEFEHQAALSLWAAKIPSAQFVPMHLSYVRSSSESAIVGWPAAIDGSWPADCGMIGLGEPFGFPVDVWLERMNEDRPGVWVSGGIASGAQAPGQSRLLLNDETFDQGMVAVRVAGANVKTLVSQGCRPIGDPMVITKSDRNVIFTLGGKPALDVVHDVFRTLPTSEQSMFLRGLQIGRVINEYQGEFQYGDFLIRNCVGIDRDDRSISIGDYVRTGQTVQFHIRDEQSASVELEQMLKSQQAETDHGAALLFSCNGRGTNLFSQPDHDAALVSSAGKRPTAGFFAAGEIGPVGDKNFLHGFTASVLLFN